MDSLVYVIRLPLEMISPFLYSKATPVTVISVEPALLAGKVVKSAADCSRKEGTMLSYRELLEVLLASQRIITL